LVVVCVLVGIGLGASACGGLRQLSSGKVTACATCHEQEVQFRDFGPHRGVDCAVCHGPGERHARAKRSPRPPVRRGGVDECLACHARGAPASRTVSRIQSLEDHLAAIERDLGIAIDPEVHDRCVYCHEPHLLQSPHSAAATPDRN